ncbi:hypothetical protein [Demequina mangrovi]|uniref:ABC-2 type transport system permease protein n=1 Tax=Demequina mangrovi TaxID=1043493 RepID=A0A1H6XS24_9MICO|nr:hypothetical protein [Demequina mangrovi]SEJ31841.1 ABC-2 type transport system permease protein [Demequina mangrovi]
MVAAVVGVRLRTAWHLVRREWWRGVVAGLGLLWMLVMLPWLIWGQAVLADQGASVRGDLLVAAVAILTLGWVVVPLVLSGLDDTLDPSRFRALGVSARTIMPGITVAAFLTLPALFVGGALGILGLSWRASGGAVLAVAIAGLALAHGCLVLAARVSAAWGARVLSSRRAKLATFTALACALAAAAPVAYVLFRDGLTAVIEADLDPLLARLGGTPLGAGVAAPERAAAGDWWGAAWRLGLQAGWLVLLHAAWRDTVAHQLVSPLGRGGGAQRRHDRILEPVRTLIHPRDPATAAVHARLIRAWVSDPRYLASLAGVLLLPVTFFALVVPVFDLDRRWAYVVPVVLAATIGWGRHNDVAFDSTALWLDLVSGRLGQAVMRGRLAASASWALPLILVTALAVIAWAGRWDHAPGLLGACIGVLGVSLGVAAVSGVVIPYRAPAPGASPFGSEVGAVGAGLVAQLASSAVLAVLVPLVLLPFVLSLTVAPAWGWVACVVGAVAGVAGYAGGVRGAGAIYDRRAGALLAAVA